MKFWSIILAFTGLLAIAGCGEKSPTHQVTLYSPNGNLGIQIFLDSANDTGMAYYRVWKNTGGEEKEILAPSRLGLQLQDLDLARGFADLQTSSQREVHDQFRLPTGKQLEVNDSGKEIEVLLVKQTGEKLGLLIRAYDDGVAFRYRLDTAHAASALLEKELTSFAFSEEGTKWSQPYDTVTKYTPAYETYYVRGVPLGATSPEPNGWSFPLTAQTAGHWVMLTETDLNGSYCGMHLQPEAEKRTYRMRLPEKAEAFGQGDVQPSFRLPWQSPWRLIVVGEDPDMLISTTLVYTLAAPSILSDERWVIPGKASWSWWSESDSPQQLDRLKAFVDLAETMSWKYSLVDANWNLMPEGSIEELEKYAEAREVDLLMWYNSGGPHNTVTEQPRDIMSDSASREQEFAWLAETGIKGVKVDFFQSDKQHIIQQYIGILEAAARHDILVNFHGCTIPRGWSRTYPHMVTLESVRGGETYKFGSDYPEKAPWHNTVLPFTRNVIGPMDYTPVTFSDVKYPHLTTYGHEIALSVVFESGIVHMADRVEAYTGLPEFARKFLVEVPAAWDETRYLAGTPGAYVVMARRKGSQWYIGGINGNDEPMDVEVTLPVAQQPNSLAVITDGPGGKSLEQVEADVKSGKLVVQLLPYGGFVAQMASE